MEEDVWEPVFKQVIAANPEFGTTQDVCVEIQKLLTPDPLDHGDDVHATRVSQGEDFKTEIHENYSTAFSYAKKVIAAAGGVPQIAPLTFEAPNLNTSGKVFVDYKELVAHYKWLLQQVQVNTISAKRIMEEFANEPLLQDHPKEIYDLLAGNFRNWAAFGMSRICNSVIANKTINDALVKTRAFEKLKADTNFARF